MESKNNGNIGRISIVSVLLLLLIAAPANAMWVSTKSVPGGVSSMEVYNGNLYAGAGNGVYIYNGTSWKLSFDSPVAGITSLGTYNGKLYASTLRTAQTDGIIYAYDGTSWNLLNYSQYGLSRQITGPFVVYNNRLYAGVSYGTTGLRFLPIIMCVEGDLSCVKKNEPDIIYTYDGAIWNESLKSSAAASVTSFAVYNGKLYALIGKTIYVTEGGGSWSVNYENPELAMTSLMAYNGKLYAGTKNNKTNDQRDYFWNGTSWILKDTYRYGRIYVYDGNSWALSDTGLGWHDLSLLAVYNNTIYATGSDDMGSTTYLYDGIHWKNMRTPTQGLLASPEAIMCEGSSQSPYGPSSVQFNDKLYAVLREFSQLCEFSLTATLASPSPVPTDASIPVKVPTPASVIATVVPTPEPTSCSLVATLAVNPEGKNCREFSGPCDVPRKWIVVSSCPTPANETPGQQCQGCLYSDSCIPFGTRLGPQYSVIPFNGSASYCDFAKKTLERQKADGGSCQNNYECLSNYCSTGVCGNLQKELSATRGLLEQILGFLRALFGKFFSFPVAK